MAVPCGPTVTSVGLETNEKSAIELHPPEADVRAGTQHGRELSLQHIACRAIAVRVV